MMGPDEIGERRQMNHTPMIALGAIAVLLLIVCAMSYRDYLRASLEKEFAEEYAEKEEQLMQRNGYSPLQQGQPQNPQGQQQPYQQNNGQAYARQPQANQQPAEEAAVSQPQPQPHLQPRPQPHPHPRVSYSGSHRFVRPEALRTS